MASTPESIDVAKAIQLALGPVFLLTGISGMLNVMAGRLSRIVDRGRALAGREAGTLSHTDTLEFKSLERRRRFVNIAITACTIAALLVCLVITALFFETMFSVQLLNWLIAALFIAATLALVFGLAFFLREIHLATTTVHVTPHPGK